LAVSPANEICLELQDHSTLRKSAAVFFQLLKSDPRTQASQAAKLAEQFITLNRPLTNLLDVSIDREYDGSDVGLVISSGSAVGAISLLSPSTARHDYGLVIQPRFPWPGIGPMLGEMGWRITPSILKLPPLHRSERRVPPWVLSSMILVRLNALLNSLSRKFELVEEHRNSPRGRVDWDTYARRSLPAGKFLSIPCTYPELEEDRLIKGSIRYTVERHLRSLETQKENGAFVWQLIELAQSLLARVRTAPSYAPTTQTLQSWMRRPMRSENFSDGLQAIEWTIEERGLAGLSDLQGLPWRLPMDQFFEAWVETVFQSVARDTGAQMKTGRQSQTTRAIDWQPSYIGSQKSLKPDIWLEWESTTLIVDAKYKRHWEELSRHSWAQVEEELRERHRNDLFQVLAYANLAQTQNVIACLAYPCSIGTWRLLKEGGRLLHKATISAGTRTVHLWLTAVPMSANAELVAREMSENIRAVVAA
jgi:hypothetical protein